MKIFRRFRFYFLEEDKFQKYLLYAIGEIVLVVLGILIALQINNKNELRKLKAEEFIMLQNLYASVQGDLMDINIYIDVFDSADRAIYIIIKHIEENLSFHDSLRYHFNLSTVMWPPRFNQEVFESLSSSDINNISNDNLKRNIIKYYYDAENTIAGMERYGNVVEGASRDIFNTRFNALWNESWADPHYERSLERMMKPRDFEALKKDEEYLYFLKSQKNQLYWYVRSRLIEARTNAEELVIQFEAELDEFEK